MAAEYETFMHRWFDEVWNQGREDAIDELFAEDGLGYGLPTENGEPIRGPQEFKPFFREFRQAFPNVKVTVGETVCDGDRISAVCRVSALHEGEGIGLSPTNQPVEFTGIVMVRLHDGKIAESWNSFDFMKMYAQLGALTLNLPERVEEEYETPLHRWFGEVWNKKREGAIDEMLSDETVHHGLGGVEGGPVRGIEGFKNFFRVFVSVFPDLQVTLKQVISDGEKMSAFYVARGTHQGGGLGIPPTGREVEFTGMGLSTLKDGKFVEVWNEVDFMNLYSQIDGLTLNLQ